MKNEKDTYCSHREKTDAPGRRCGLFVVNPDLRQPLRPDPDACMFPVTSEERCLVPKALKIIRSRTSTT